MGLQFSPYDYAVNIRDYSKLFCIQSDSNVGCCGVCVYIIFFIAVFSIPNSKRGYHGNESLANSIKYLFFVYASYLPDKAVFLMLLPCPYAITQAYSLRIMRFYVVNYLLAYLA